MLCRSRLPCDQNGRVSLRYDGKRLENALNVPACAYEFAETKQSAHLVHRFKSTHISTNSRYHHQISFQVQDRSRIDPNRDFLSISIDNVRFDTYCLGIAAHEVNGTPLVAQIASQKVLARDSGGGLRSDACQSLQRPIEKLDPAVETEHGEPHGISLMNWGRATGRSARPLISER